MGLGDLVIDALGIRPGALVALVGAGGKSTLMQELHRAGSARGWRCATGTTTKVYASQADALPGFLHSHREGDKLVGLPPEDLDRWVREHRPDLCVIEADGARSRRVKAPSLNEPVIPRSTTLVIAVIAADAVNRVIEDVAHRPMLVAAVCGCGPYSRLTPQRACTLLASDRGGRKHVPEGAGFAVAITRIGPRQQADAGDLATLLADVGVPVVMLQRIPEAPEQNPNSVGLPLPPATRH